MRLVNVLALTDGLLINDPFVSNFTNIVFEAKAVKRGDLFLAFDKKTIQDAIINGAYGIIYDKAVKISDDEIAWIKVDSTLNALKKLLRFRLVEKNIVAFETDEITLKLSLKMMIDPKLIIVNGDIQKVSKQIWNIEEKSTLLFSPTLCDKDIFTNIKQIPKSTKKFLKVLENTLFETSFVYKDTLYERQMVSPLFIKNLERLLTLLEKLEVNFRFRKFTQIENFEPIFVNNNLEIKEFGSSDKVIIFEKNYNLFYSQQEFLQKKANWAKILYLVPTDFNLNTELYSNLYSYKTTNGILKILKKHNFNFAYILGSDKSILNKPLINQIQLTLDF